MAATKTKQKGKKKVPKKVGRKSTYTIQKAEKICEFTATSNKSLKTICEEIGIPVMTVLKWLRKNEEFGKIYARAKEEQADLLAEEIISISDDSSEDLVGIDDYGNRIENKEFVNRSKLRVDARKWIAAKLKPRKYGDKLDLNHSGEVSVQWQEEKTYETKPKAD